MYKLRRSRFVKFIAGVLIVTLCAAIVGNLVGTYLLMEENLYYASRQQIQQKVYSYIYQYTASDLMRYLKTAENIYSNDDYYRNYNQSELDLYKEKYSSKNSNILFEITDEFGNLLLKNENRNFQTGDVLRFTSGYGWSYLWHNDGYYSIGGSEKADLLVTEAATSSYYEEDTTAEEYTSFFDNETTTLKEAVSTRPLPETDNTQYFEKIYTITNEYSGYNTSLLYKYSNEINNEIFNFIKERVAELPCNITEITVIQDDFYVEYYGDYTNDGYEVLAAYNPTDNTVPTKSFTTTVLTNGKEVTLNYSYNGSFSFSQFNSRLKHISLAALNSDKDNLSFDIHQKENVQIKVQVIVPCHTDYIKDVYFYAEQFVDLAIIYKDNIIPITVIDFIGLIVSLIFIFWSAGFIPKRVEPIARGLHAIPFDLYILLSALAAVGCFALIDTNDELFTLFGFMGWAFIVISIIYTIPVRVRAKKLRKNTVIYKIYHAVKRAVQITDEATGSRLSILIIVFVFILISLCEIFLFAIWGSDEAAIFKIFARLIELPILLFCLVVLTALHSGAKAISKGDISYRISTSYLFGPFRKHAEYLNSINNAVNNAVEERLKSESLKTELITNVSHDLKTPLTSIVNYIDLLKKTDVRDEKAIQYIDVIDRQSQRLKKLTIDIVEASKAATGNIEVSYEATALNVILLQTNGEYIERLQEKNLTLVQDIPDENIVISTDGRLLWRVIDNLMNNICKYSMPGTRVYLSLWQHGGRAFISFRNISKTKLNINPEALTERFVRGDTSRNTEGSGLGLSIANSLTEIMGGKLSIIIDGDLFKVTLSFPTIKDEKSE